MSVRGLLFTFRTFESPLSHRSLEEPHKVPSRVLGTGSLPLSSEAPVIV